MGTGIVAGTVSVGILILALTAVTVFHNRRSLQWHKTAFIGAALSGLLLSGTLAAYAGSIRNYTIYGVGLVFGIAIVGGFAAFLAWKGHGHHPLWTPVLVLIVAVAIGQMFPKLDNHVASTTVSVVHKGSSAASGG